MTAFLRRFIYALSSKIWRNKPGGFPEGKLTVDFAKIKKSPFNIKSESSYNANLSNGSLELALTKTNCIAWVDIPEKEYQDHVIEARIRLDSFDGYAAAGILFHIRDEDSYYMALVSSKGYFRLDLVKGNIPRPLIAWTEIPDFKHQPNLPGTDISQIDVKKFKIQIITYGTYLIFIINDKWLGEVNDDSIAYGGLAFAAASYAENEGSITENCEHTCKAYLDYISIDTRIKTIESCFKKWTDDSNINAENRLRIAETFAVMGESLKSMEQITKAWKRRDEVISTVSSTVSVRTRKELLLASRMSFRLGHYNEAEEYINTILDQWQNSPEEKMAYSEKLKILNELNRFAEIKDFVKEHSSKINKDIDYYTLLGRCYWELKEYKDCALAWDKAFELNKENGVYAVNAANAHEYAGNKEEALKQFITAAKLFLNQGNMPELEALMTKLSVMGEKNWEARTLTGKWAFTIEDYNKCVEEFTIANKLRIALKPRPKADPASYYLWGLVLHLKGKNKEALRLLERSVKLAPDYGLFRFKLTEYKIKYGMKDSKASLLKTGYKQFACEFKLALESMDDSDGNMTNYAGNLLLNIGDAKNAKYFFDTAKTKQ